VREQRADLIGAARGRWLSSGSGLQHGIGITVDGADQDGPTVAPGSTSTVTVTLRPGTYTCYCPVPSHRAAGMTGTLTIS
jgi:uncharacterized cupredoxin-like copper-binding protein